jgi:hypothetical protein
MRRSMGSSSRILSPIKPGLPATELQTFAQSPTKTQSKAAAIQLFIAFVTPLVRAEMGAS